MRLGKLVSVGEVVDQEPAAAPGPPPAAAEQDAPVLAGEDNAQVPTTAHASR